VVGVGSRAPFLGPFETPAGVIQPTGTKLDFPGTDFWYVREGKIQEFKRHVGTNIMFAQLGVQPDFAAAAAASAACRSLQNPSAHVGGRGSHGRGDPSV
jgi:hypothetical protein